MVEVALSIGIVSFALLVLVALLPAGLRANQAAAEETVAIGILSSLEADLRNSPGTDPISVHFRINRSQAGLAGNAPTQIWLGDEGQVVSDRAKARFRLLVEILDPLVEVSQDTRRLSCRARVAWPAGASVREDGSAVTDSVEGSVEVYVAAIITN